MRTSEPRAVLLVVLLALLAAACSSSAGFRKMRVEIAAPKPVAVDAFRRLLVSDFWVETDVAGIDLNRELRTYWRDELARAFGTDAVLIETPLTAEPDFADPAAWRRTGPEAGESLLLAGTARLKQETRKALTEEALKELDGPFAPEKKIVERRVVTLELTVALLRAGSGDLLYRREFKETKSSDNINQPAAFVFFELLHQAKQKLLRAVLGESRLLDRYIITD